MEFDTMEQFKEEVLSKIKEFLPNAEETGYYVSIEETLKNNDMVLTGLVIREENNSVAPTIYLEPFLEKWKNGDYMSMRGVLQNIARVYSEAKPPVFNIEEIRTFDDVKDKIVRQLVNYDANQTRLEHAPHIQYENLAIVYRIELENNEDGLASIFLDDRLFERYGVSLEELDNIAMENTKRLHPPVIDSVVKILFEMEKDILMEMFDADEEKSWDMFCATYNGMDTMLIVKNQNNMNGAIHILDEAVMDQLAEKLGEKFVVIPSSIHEVIAMPFDGDFGAYVSYEEMIHEVNTSELSEDEYLSFNAYLVDSKEHVLLRMDRAEEYYKEQEKKQEKQKEMSPEESNNERQEVHMKYRRLP